MSLRGLIPERVRDVRGFGISVVLSNVRQFENSISWVVYVSVIENRDAVKARVYTYGQADNEYKLVKDIGEGDGDRGSIVCNRVRFEYDIELRFNWQKFSQEYAVSREV